MLAPAPSTRTALTTISNTPVAPKRWDSVPTWRSPSDRMLATAFGECSLFGKLRWKALHPNRTRSVVCYVLRLHVATEQEERQGCRGNDGNEGISSKLTGSSPTTRAPGTGCKEPCSQSHSSPVWRDRQTARSAGSSPQSGAWQAWRLHTARWVGSGLSRTPVIQV